MDESIWEANIDGTVNVNYHDMRISSAPVKLAVYQSGARPVVRNTTTFVPYSATGTRHDIQKLNTVCIGCHSAASATAVPFGDGNTPQKYAWDGKSIDEIIDRKGAAPDVIAAAKLCEIAGAHQITVHLRQDRRDLDPGALKGARIGVARKNMFGSSPAADRIAEEAIAAMRSAGVISLTM